MEITDSFEYILLVKTWMGVSEMVCATINSIKYMDQESNNGKRNNTLKVLQPHNVIYVVCLFLLLFAWGGMCNACIYFPCICYDTTNIAVSNYLVFPSDSKRRHRLISFISFIYRLFDDIEWSAQNAKSLILQRCSMYVYDERGYIGIGTNEELYVWSDGSFWRL